MISKELLSIIESEELSIVNADSISCKLKNNEIVIKCKYLDTKLTPTFYYNIYELAHKCKEWAVNLSPNKHALSSYPRWGDIRNYKKTNGSYYICQHLVSGVQFEAESEPEAIFKACQWILDKDSK